MAVRGSAMTRALDYFEKADIREAQFVLQEATATLKRRGAEKRPVTVAKARQPRKQRVNSASGETSHAPQEKTAVA